MLCASRIVLNINYHYLNINYFINFYSCSIRQIAVYRTYIHTFSKPLIYLSCFIFCYKVIGYQSFQKVKHTTLMFHF